MKQDPKRRSKLHLMKFLARFRECMCGVGCLSQFTCYIVLRSRSGLKAVNLMALATDCFAQPFVSALSKDLGRCTVVYAFA